MTKIGYGKEHPKKRSVQDYRKELDRHLSRFLKALEVYHDHYEEGTRERERRVMDEEVRLIKAASDEISGSGIHKHEVKLEHLYRAYINASSLEALLALKDVVATLREANKIP
jgi:hypothetical protein